MAAPAYWVAHELCDLRRLAPACLFPTLNTSRGQCDWLIMGRKSLVDWGEPEGFAQICHQLPWGGQEPDSLVNFEATDSAQLWLTSQHDDAFLWPRTEVPFSKRSLRYPESYQALPGACRSPPQGLPCQQAQSRKHILLGN